jgi:hypothetical protein
VTLLRDSTTGDEGSGAGKSTGGAIAGRVLNAIDGKRISTFAKLRGCNSGFDKRGWECTGDPRFLIFKATKLVAQVPVANARFNINLADGDYTCLATYPGAQAFYDKNCHVKGKKLDKDLNFSPVLAPGMVRVVLTWGAAVKDLDSFMLTPHKDLADPPCEVNWSNRKCLSESVKLDKDDKRGFGPETITVNQIRSDGRFRYRVSEYKGNSNDNSERLKLSEANVAVYTMGGYLEYRVGKDGFIKGNNWYVFTIDSNGKIQPCNEDTCGHGYHDPKGSA